MTASIVLAFSAGMVATVNPCGFAMLPAYLSYFMGIDDGGSSRTSTLRSALVVGGIVSVGFLVVFGIAGAVISGLISGIGRTAVIEWIPWLALAAGIAVSLLGIAMLFGYEMVVGLPKAKRGGVGGGYRKVFAFGTSYAVASLSCTLPVFLTVVATQFTTRTFVGGLTIFFAYAAGMATVLMGLTVVLALGKRRLLGRLRASARVVTRVSGLVLVLAGAWIVWFWATSISSGASGLGENPALSIVDDLSQTALNIVSDNALVVAVAFAAFIGFAARVVLRAPRDDIAIGDEPSDGQDVEIATHGEPGF